MKYCLFVFKYTLQLGKENNFSGYSVRDSLISATASVSVEQLYIFYNTYSNTFGIQLPCFSYTGFLRYTTLITYKLIL